VHVDKARRDNEAARVKRVGARQRLFCDASDPVSANADVANGVQAGFRIDHATTQDDGIVGFEGSLIGASGNNKRERCNGEKYYMSACHRTLSGYRQLYHHLFQKSRREIRMTATGRPCPEINVFHVRKIARAR
jgi:hypothetical protein